VTVIANIQTKHPEKLVTNRLETSIRLPYSTTINWTFDMKFTICHNKSIRWHTWFSIISSRIFFRECRATKWTEVFNFRPAGGGTSLGWRGSLWEWGKCRNSKKLEFWSRLILDCDVRKTYVEIRDWTFSSTTPSKFAVFWRTYGHVFAVRSQQISIRLLHWLWIIQKTSNITQNFSTFSLLDSFSTQLSSPLFNLKQN
jgi:hypothetical protein